MPHLTADELIELEGVVLGSDGDAFCEYMRAQVLGQPIDLEWKRVAQSLAQKLGWEDPRTEKLTRDGVSMAHPFRELLIWEERDRAMPKLQGEVFVDLERLRDKDVLEVGSGFGVNLLSMQGVARSTVGLEIEEGYAQVTPILSKKAGLEAPEILVSPAETLPFDDASFDSILCLGALQYMEFDKALSEMKRVTRPRGEVILVLGHFDGYLKGSKHAFSGSPVNALREARNVATMLTYRWLGRAFNNAHSPVYPTHGGMRRWLKGAGLELENLRVIGHETVYQAARI